MGESNDEKPVLRSWQRTSDPAAPTPSEQQEPKPDAQETETENRASLIEKAAKFLEAEGIRNASRERKTEFLLGKGLSGEDVHGLLDENQTTEAPVAEGVQTEQQDVSGTTSPSMSSESIPQSSPEPARDVPPIITYPEFLLHSQKPPPLITAGRLFATLYIASGAAATIYGGSKYVVEPMIQSLTSARHSLFETASENIEQLNQKLEQNVSKLPETGTLHEDSDTGLEDDDPARFFTRSTATQTSPSLSQSTSSLNSSHLLEDSQSVITSQQEKLEGIQSQLKTLLPSGSEDSAHIKKSLEELRGYLDELANPSRANSAKKAVEKDEVAKFKAGIRGVKGMLLSARNFPSGVAVR
ncbi:hypothetical protein MMC21_002494 [Puttea exsequens]|nr:hypothetical protein [Puttea exsequens]